MWAGWLVGWRGACLLIGDLYLSMNLVKMEFIDEFVGGGLVDRFVSNRGKMLINK